MKSMGSVLLDTGPKPYYSLGVYKGMKYIKQNEMYLSKENKWKRME